ncbi:MULTISPECIES: ketopantoate reductase family protein [Haloferacaceae]|uniref:2-dehydropantoate 2-reductase n=1 Tax=Halorubrum glutamatedens TaxID=2707018 RepID=A0ABD5QNN4_9EURY|nr:2-dehydropantoate 2-reductase [Halobellus captivus]
MKIAVYGAGGIGGYFGGQLASAGADVHLIARGSHLAAIQEDGLHIESIHGDFHVNLPATDDPAEIGECDYVLVCVKSFDTEAIIEKLGPLLGSETAVISLQNGVDNERKLAAEIGEEHVMGGLAYIFSTISEPGHVQHADGPARIIFGEIDGTRSNRAERLRRLCKRADGMEGVHSADIWIDLWEKFMFICAQAGSTAAIRLPIDEIRDVDESWKLFCGLLEEARDVAVAEGVEVTDTALEEWIKFAKNLDEGTYSSLYHDMVNGNRMELEALHGTLVRKADEHDISVPWTRSVYAVLYPWAVRNAPDQ